MYARDRDQTVPPSRSTSFLRSTYCPRSTVRSRGSANLRASSVYSRLYNTEPRLQSFRENRDDIRLRRQRPIDVSVSWAILNRRREHWRCWHIHSHVQQYATLFDYHDASHQVDRNTVIPENVRVRFHEYRDLVVHRADVRLIDRCLLSTHRRGQRRPVTRRRLRWATRFLARIDRHVARLSLDTRQFLGINASLRRRPLWTRRVPAIERDRRRWRLERHFSFRHELDRGITSCRRRRKVGNARSVGDSSLWTGRGGGGAGVLVDTGIGKDSYGGGGGGSGARVGPSDLEDETAGFSAAAGESEILSGLEGGVKERECA